MVIIYPDKITVIYFNEIINLLKLKNQGGIRLLYPEISKWLSEIIKEAINRPIYPGVNKEPQAKVKR